MVNKMAKIAADNLIEVLYCTMYENIKIFREFYVIQRIKRDFEN
jgi:hypothetical protein